jgi:hypothetical protein
MHSPSVSLWVGSTIRASDACSRSRTACRKSGRQVSCQHINLETQSEPLLPLSRLHSVTHLCAGLASRQRPWQRSNTDCLGPLASCKVSDDCGSTSGCLATHSSLQKATGTPDTALSDMHAALSDMCMSCDLHSVTAARHQQPAHVRLNMLVNQLSQAITGKDSPPPSRPQLPPELR